VYARTFPGSVASIAAIRGDIARFAAECGFSEVEIYDVRIAVSEIVTNAVVHAYAETTGDVRVNARCAEGELEVVIADDGPGMAPRLHSPGLGLGLPTAAGAASDMAVVTPDGGGTEVRLTFRRTPCAGPCGVA
jgi:anti-sigma regulatory factor (Ser/Thr protein kinase)